jgi:dihydroxyacetone kinase-like protein
MEQLLSDLPFSTGDEVCLLLNDLGSTSLMELLIVNRRARQILDARRIRVHDTMIGSFCTCQEMAGCSISLLKLDDELRRFYDMPARSLGFTKGEL